LYSIFSLLFAVLVNDRCVVISLPWLLCHHSHHLRLPAHTLEVLFRSYRLFTMSNDDFNVQDVPTSMISFVETQHGRERLKQRGIDKKDLQAALKYGLYTEAKWGFELIVNPNQTRILHRGIVYIVDNEMKTKVTCWANSTPLKPIPITPQLQIEYHHTNALMSAYPMDTSWRKSNTVLVVDTSGSMREADV
jgi:hypothetical protein